jgi:adenine-specific DNA-methyltransferase
MTDASPAPQGRLELTWTNKHLRLLSPEDGSYEWVPPGDYRVAEVRLLDNAATVGETRDDRDRASDNLLIRGDALNALTSLAELPEFASEYVGKVTLAYLDPPFNTQQAFLQYDDALEHSVWLTMMRDRVRVIKKLLAAEGSIWVHLDHVESHRCRAVLDEEFGPANFVCEVAWQKADNTRSNNRGFSVSHDVLLVYRKSDAWVPNRMARAAALDAKYTSPDGDPERWFDGPTTVRGDRKHHDYIHAIQHPITGDLIYPTRSRHWAKSRDWIFEQMSAYAPYEERLINDVERRAAVCGIPVSAMKADVPALMLTVPLEEAAAQAEKRYAEGNWPDIVLRSGGRGGIGFKLRIPTDGSVPTTWWRFDEVGSNRTAKSEIKALFPGEHAFDTPKPERLLRRVLHIATSPGDLVLDCFAGSGTTAAVAHKMGRRWVTIEREQETIDRYTLPRLTKVVDGSDRGGISRIEERVADADLPGEVTPDEAARFTTLLGRFRDALLGDAEEEGDDREWRNQVDAVVNELLAVAKTRKVTGEQWAGGGGFRVLDVAPSMFAEDAGMVYLADWATKGRLAEACAAQLHFEVDPDPPFVGRKGRTRLAVVDGLVNEDAVRLLVNALPEPERLTVCGTAVDPMVRKLLRELRPGSSARKIPQAILEDYRLPRWVPRQGPETLQGEAEAAPTTRTETNSAVASTEEAEVLA